MADRQRPVPTMPRLTIAPNLRRHVDCPPLQLDGGTVGEVLSAAWQHSPRLQGYVLDEQGAVRQHVMVFVNGQRIHDRLGLSDAVAPADEVQIFQALTGG